MKFTVIIPSYNQHLYIEETLRNALDLKEQARSEGDEVELLLFDSESGAEVQQVISRYRDQLDYVEIRKDKGQYDAINKGISRCSGEYWTWLNTDDTIDPAGFSKLRAALKKDPAIDYIYGGIDYIDSDGRIFRSFPAYQIDPDTLVKKVPGIFQQGSFFRSAFTRQIGLLKPYNCCFDYEFVLRCLSHGAKVHKCDFKVANFRQHSVSKTGSLTRQFISEQLQISKSYGRKFWHFLSWFSALRLLKHKLFPR